MRPCHQIFKMILPVGMFFLFSCESLDQEQQETPSDTVREQFVRANQYMYRRHQDHIAAFVSRVGWDAEVTPSGLWIVRETGGEGKRIEEGSRVVYSFTSRLLDGTSCYEASEEDPEVVVIGRGGVESGVEEGLRKLREGSEATLIIPPHLAHGNFGDGNRIPGNSVLLYKVRILDVQ
ncbi:MAG: FKBP-type peptidyl-prolyl cis-trans isomerase [Bacteroidales bacterium]